MTNLEWLLSDHNSVLFKALDCCHCVYSYNDGSYCRADITESKCDYDDCERGHCEWLMAEHADAQLEPAPLLSGYGEFLSDANDDSAPENVVTGGIVDANDGNDALDSRDKEERIAELQDLLRALERELRIARGDLKLTLNNWEQAKGKLRRQEQTLAERRRRLDERDRRTAEEVRGDRADYWRARAEKAEAEREEWRAKCGRMADLAGGMLQVAP